MIRPDDVYRIGQLNRAHGLGGELIFSFEDDIFDRQDADYLICDVDGILVPFFIEEYKFKTDTSVIIKFEDIDSPEQAAQLQGSSVYYERKAASSQQNSDEGEFSLHYFVGFTIVDHGKTIGTIAAVNDSTMNWLFITDNDILIPATADFITDINHEKKVITMNLPEGMVELNSED